MIEIDEKTVKRIVDWLREQQEAVRVEAAEKRMSPDVWWSFKTAADLIESGEWLNE